MSASSEKKYSRKQPYGIFLVSQTNFAQTNAFNWVQYRESLLPLTFWWNLRTRQFLKKTLCFAMRSRRRGNFSVARFSWSWSGKMGKTKKDTNARVVGRRKQTKESAAEQLRMDITFQLVSDLSTSLIIAVKFPNFYWTFLFSWFYFFFGRSIR